MAKVRRRNDRESILDEGNSQVNKEALFEIALNNLRATQDEAWSYLCREAGDRIAASCQNGARSKALIIRTSVQCAESRQVGSDLACRAAG
jgi:hypothetical protein